MQTPKSFLPYFLLISIIAAAIILAIPGEEQHTRRRVARARSDLRTLDIALCTYYTDHHTLPRMIPMKEVLNQTDSQELHGQHLQQTIFPGSETCEGLTTPVAYLTYLFPSPFGDGIPYSYHASDDRLIVYHPGPDKQYDILKPGAFLKAETQVQAHHQLSRYSYNPTNGIISNGDIYRIHFDLKNELMEEDKDPVK